MGDGKAAPIARRGVSWGPYDEAQQFTAHSIRSGAAIEATPSVLTRGIAGNMRADLMDRLRISWSLGLW